MSPSVLLALVAVGAPLAAALLSVLIPPLRHRGTPSAVLTIVGSVLATGAAGALVAQDVAGRAIRATVPWMLVQGRGLGEIGVRLDAVSIPMLAVVCLVALAVQVYSLAYMHGETHRSYGRYFTYHALFLFSMNTLVLAPDLLQAFAGWELVGLVSYLLIGFHFDRPTAARAAVKAFWMTKLADMGFLFALLLLYSRTGAFSWDVALRPEVAEATAALIFIAVMGKSAQFPLHVWLPDAMEGPTPVSALLHAATMVAAGVYLVVRADPLFTQAHWVQGGMLWIGTITAVFAALLGLVQTDIKRVLAYSTCSQLGFMVAALGAGSAFAGYFHLGTHAFFKALLFLGAGSVIHAVHSNFMSDMGGLGRKMPLTAATFAVGSAVTRRRSPVRRLRLEGCHPHRRRGACRVDSVGAAPGHRLPDRVLHGPGAGPDLPRQALGRRRARARVSGRHDRAAARPRHPHRGGRAARPVARARDG